jgi:hypothetical protein
LGAIIPLGRAAYFLVTHQFGVVQSSRDANSPPVSFIAWLDMLIFSLAVLVFVNLEAQRLGMRHRWLYGLATLTAGPSLGLPLFLYGRWNQPRSESVQAYFIAVSFRINVLMDSYGLS